MVCKTASHGEEKKDDSVESPKTDDEEVQVDTEEDEVVSLSSQLREIFGSRTFHSEEELYGFMEKEGVGDARVILIKGKPRQIMPTDQHNKFTSNEVYRFARLHGAWGYVTATHNVHLYNNSHREPDLSFFGYPRCVRDREEGTWKPYDDGAVPDVIIQFSWKNKKGYEEEAINDMMNFAREKERGSQSSELPRVGYLIKVRFSKKRPLPKAVKGSKTQDLEGLDVYRLPKGTRIEDADKGVNGASKWTYFPTGGDREIKILPHDLGITGFWAFLWGGYSIKLSRLFKDLNDYHVQRQDNGLTT